MELETRCDPAGEIAELANRREQVRQLEHLVTRLKRNYPNEHREDLKQIHALVKAGKYVPALAIMETLMQPTSDSRPAIFLNI